MSPEATVVLELQNRDGTTQEVAGTIPLPRGSSNETDEEGEMLPHVELVCG